MLVELDEVSFSHRETPVLRNFSLAIPEGTHSILIGTSGSGKSTLFKATTAFPLNESRPIVVTGVLELTGQDESGIFYRLKSARPG